MIVISKALAARPNSLIYEIVQLSAHIERLFRHATCTGSSGETRYDSTSTKSIVL